MREGEVDQELSEGLVEEDERVRAGLSELRRVVHHLDAVEADPVRVGDVGPGRRGDGRRDGAGLEVAQEEAQFEDVQGTARFRDGAVVARKVVDERLCVLLGQQDWPAARAFLGERRAHLVLSASPAISLAEFDPLHRCRDDGVRPADELFERRSLICR